MGNRDPLSIAQGAVGAAGVRQPVLRAIEKDAGEKTLAERLVGEKSLTPGQWRARTMFSYALPEDAVPNPAQLPAAIDLPLSGSLSMRLLRIDPGTFVHGAPREELGRRTNELPPERVAVEKPFCLAVQGGECRVTWRTQISSDGSPSNQVGFRLVLRFRTAAPAD